MNILSSVEDLNVANVKIEEFQELIKKKPEDLNTLNYLPQLGKLL
jgi:hypothetical protein